MVRIRLRRVGSKKQASYRIVAADKRSPRDGRYIEVLGAYNPRTRPETIEVNEARALYWLSVGAQPSDSVGQLFKKNGTLDRFARMRQGEAIETLVAEAEAAKAAQVISPKTRYLAPVKAAEKGKPEAAAEAAE
jgi:small subunit ribosomal protein S16